MLIIWTNITLTVYDTMSFQYDLWTDSQKKLYAN